MENNKNKNDVWLRRRIASNENATLCFYRLRIIYGILCIISA